MGAGEQGSWGAGEQGMDSFSNSFFSRNERSGRWTVDRGSFFEFTFFEDRMVGWLKIEDRGWRCDDADYFDGFRQAQPTLSKALASGAH